jgi:hypothetical protein
MVLKGEKNVSTDPIVHILLCILSHYTVVSIYKMEEILSRSVHPKVHN